MITSTIESFKFNFTSNHKTRKIITIIWAKRRIEIDIFSHTLGHSLSKLDLDFAVAIYREENKLNFGRISLNDDFI